MGTLITYFLPLLFPVFMAAGVRRAKDMRTTPRFYQNFLGFK
jgi:hypothetical protein